MQSNTSIIMLNTSLIVPNKYQPRKIFDETSLNKLANSIKNYGIINPILVRQKDDKYEIIAGERRFRAAKLIGLTEIPVIIKNADEQQMAELALIENLERQNLNPIEEAKSYEEIMRIGNQTQVSLASKLNKSQSSIANKIRLLSLPQEIQDALSNRKISERHARSLLSVTPKERQLELLNKIITEKLTVKETEQIINEKEINEEEIKKAINDIMKSLNIETEEDDFNKKEKKEDDNMNNGNFFPNFDNNNINNNNASLNMMNMQSMNQAPITPEPEMVMPTLNQSPMEPIIQQSDPMMNQFGQFAQPATNTEQVVQQAPIPESFMGGMPTMEVPQPTPSPMINEVPLFGGQSQQNYGVQQPQITPMMDESLINNNSAINATYTLGDTSPEPPQITPMMDAPLFNQNIVMPTIEPMVPSIEPSQPTPSPTEQTPLIMSENQVDTPLVTPTPYEIPVVSEAVTLEEPVSIVNNRLQELQNLLNSNGYEYKLYGNDTTDCIIIELSRN